MVVKELCVVFLLVGITSAQLVGGVNNGPPSSRTKTASSASSAADPSPGPNANAQFFSPEEMQRLKLFLAALPDLGPPPRAQHPVVEPNRHHQTATAQRNLLPVAHVQTPITKPVKPANGVEQHQITQNQKSVKTSQQPPQSQQPLAPQPPHPSTQQQQLLPSTQHQLQLQAQQLPPELQSSAHQHFPPNLQGLTGFQSTNQHNGNMLIYVNNHISAFEKPFLGHSFGLSNEQKFKVLEGHNKYRSDIPYTSGTTGMNVLRWNETLAERAAAEISSCLYFNKGNGAIYAMIYEKHTGTSLISEAVSRWADEKNKFRLASPCSVVKACRYSQIVWADTKEVGCARQTCNDMSMIACMYDPPGNVIGERAYAPGRVCSRCAPGSRCNTDNLCEW